jgi:hypothetical protein
MHNRRGGGDTNQRRLIILPPDEQSFDQRFSLVPDVGLQAKCEKCGGSDSVTLPSGYVRQWRCRDCGWEWFTLPIKKPDAEQEPIIIEHV